MGSVSHPNPVLPIPSSVELPLTKHSGELGVGGHKLVDMSGYPQREPGQGAWWGGDTTLPQRHQIPLLTWHSSAAGRGHKDFPTRVKGPSPALMLM